MDRPTCSSMMHDPSPTPPSQDYDTASDMDPSYQLSGMSRDDHIPPYHNGGGPSAMTSRVRFAPQELGHLLTSHHGHRMNRPIRYGSSDHTVVPVSQEIPDPSGEVPCVPVPEPGRPSSSHHHHHTDSDNPDGLDPMTMPRSPGWDDDDDDDDDDVDEVDEDLTPAQLDLLSLPSKAYSKAEQIARRVWEAGWTVVHHNHLPKWLRDNDFLIKGHRPPLNSFYACFKSIFRIHTETGNIWTHLLGFVAFLGVAISFLTRPSVDIQWQEKAVFSAFFVGAILCLGFSWVFHTVYCHSENVGRFFNKLDYCGIALLTMGSFVPWLYYSFYCRLSPKIVYLVLIFVLGISCIVVSMWDKFAQPKFRPVRAGMFIGLGLSGVIPAVHYIITDGFWEAINYAALGWLFLMAVLYISGAVIYACRFPERVWPGKFDIWFQSHQIFHIFVIAAAFVHYHGISNIATYRLTFGDCLEDE